MARLLVAAAALALVGSGCATAVSGRPVARGPATPGAAPASGLDCGRSTVSASVACLQQSLGDYWRRTLHRDVVVHVVTAPAPGAVPRACRAALKLETAFTCPIGDSVYLTAPYLARLRNAAPRSEAWLRIAATLAHETGHVVQFALREPQVERSHPTAAQTRQVEQQADCMSGLWAAAVGIPDQQFRTAASGVLRIVDSPFERRTHGSPAQRLTAIGVGQNGRTPSACGVTVR